MANSFTTNLNLTKPEVGADTDAWGGHLNGDLDTLDAIFANGTGTAVGMSHIGKNLNVTAGNTSFKDGTDATKVAQFNASGITTGTTRTLTVPDASGTIALTSNIMGRNRIINGDMETVQRASSATVTAGTAVPTASTGYPCCDRWFVYSTGANVTAEQDFVFSASVADGTGPKRTLKVTGAASVTAIGIGQRIEQKNMLDMQGQTCTLSAYISNSLLTTVTWTASYANTTNTFGTIGTPTKTQIATGTFTVTSSLVRYSASFSVPATVTSGIEILFTVGAQTSGTFSLSSPQFEVGSVATPFERLSYGTQLALCQRYYAQFTIASFRGYNVSASNVLSSQLRNLQTMRATPTGAIVTQPTSTSNITGSVAVGETTLDYFTVSFTGTAAGQSFYSTTVVSLAAEVS